MKTKTTIFGLAVAGLLAGSFLLGTVITVNADSGVPTTDYRGWGGRGGRGQGQPQSGNTLTPLSTEEESGLEEAILEEWGALQTYLSMDEQLGGQTVFAEIAASEQRHLDTLVRQAEKYGVQIPELMVIEPVTFASEQDACAMGVAAEIADADLYDEIMADTDRQDLLRVYSNLQRASLEQHLPVFEACQ